MHLIKQSTFLCCTFTVCLCTISAKASDYIPFDSRNNCGEFGAVETKAAEVCSSRFGDNLESCRKLIHDLSRVNDPSPDQRAALIRARDQFTRLESNPEERDEIRQQILMDRRSLVEDHPGNPMWTYVLALAEEQNSQKILLFRRVLDLKPTCVEAAYLLSVRYADMGYALSDKELYAHLVTAQGYDLHAYEYSTGHAKFVYANRYMYRSKEVIEIEIELQTDPGDYLYYYSQYDDRVDELYSAFRERVVNDMNLHSLPLDEDHRADTLDLICDPMVLTLDLEDICFSAIMELADRDAKAGRPLGVDLLRNIGPLAEAILSSPATLQLVYRTYDIDGDFGEGANYIVFFRDLLDREPEKHRSSPLFYETYGAVVGITRRLEMYRKAWELDPNSGRLGMMVGDLLRRLERYDEAGDAYYRVITDSDDRRPERGRWETWPDKAEWARQRMEQERSEDGNR